LYFASLESGKLQVAGGFPADPGFILFPIFSIWRRQAKGTFTSSMLSLVIGGARSGKSRFAESLGLGAQHVVYLATARCEDAEMAARIARHRADRPAYWVVIEEPLEIASAVERHASECSFLLLDCLTLWLSNFCWEHRGMAEAGIHSAALREVARVAKAANASHVVLVTNEVGCGLVPESPLGRFFRDLQGWVNQDAARLADWVHHVVAGIPVTIKQPGGGR
jgi:adenosylcobinamide kinase/adenosylcobinamide-phosphate guanylyltransferase